MNGTGNAQDISAKAVPPATLKVLVCGGRDFNDWTLLAGALDGVHRPERLTWWRGQKPRTSKS